MIDALSPQLHIVHYDLESYGTLSEAAQRPQGLAVLGILIEVSGPHSLPGPSPAPQSPSVPFRPCLSLVSLLRQVSNHSAHFFSTWVCYRKHGLMPGSPFPPFVSHVSISMCTSSMLWTQPVQHTSLTMNFTKQFQMLGFQKS